ETRLVSDWSQAVRSADLGHDPLPAVGERPELPGIGALADGGDGGRGRSLLRGARRRRAGDHALDRDILLAALRHDHRPLRRVLDGLRGASGRGQRGEGAMITGLRGATTWSEDLNNLLP